MKRFRDRRVEERERGHSTEIGSEPASPVHCSAHLSVCHACRLSTNQPCKKIKGMVMSKWIQVQWSVSNRNHGVIERERRENYMKVEGM